MLYANNRNGEAAASDGGRGGANLDVESDVSSQERATKAQHSRLKHSTSNMSKYEDEIKKMKDEEKIRESKRKNLIQRKLASVKGMLQEERDGPHWADGLVPKVDFEMRMLTQDQCGKKFVIHQSNMFRNLWTTLITILLIYTGTIFVYRICFVTFRIEKDPDYQEGDVSEYTSTKSGDDVLAPFDTSVFWIFVVDLVANFFFTYEDEHGVEVESLRLIFSKYMRTYFFVNFIACIPEPMVTVIIETSVDAAPSAINQSVRTFRLYRVSRLMKLLRLARLGKCARLRNSRIIRKMDKHRGLRVVNLTCGLVWTVHLLACGWYLCAALHEIPEETWVGRRPFKGDDTLLEAGPLDQWTHAMYFVLTIFTTVGFGDMTAVTSGEIMYVSVVMLIGTVVHSVIISQVIGVVTSIDKTNEFVASQVDLIDAFSQHTELEDGAKDEVRGWIQSSAKFWVSHRFDKQAMREMITSRGMPRSLLGKLPPLLFEGKLLTNAFCQVCKTVSSTPPRLPLLIALVGHKMQFLAGDIVYQTQDFAFNVFLVMSGTFAFVAVPSQQGGLPFTKSMQCLKKVPRVKVPAAPINAINAERMKNAVTWAASQAKNQVKVIKEFSSQASMEYNESANSELSPYQMFSHGAYFGEIEFFKNCQRKTTARCEIKGATLTLHRNDMKQLCEEFPQFGSRWAVISAHREKLRIIKQIKLTTNTTCEQLAGQTIALAVSRFKQMSMRKISEERVEGMPSVENERAESKESLSPVIDNITSLLPVLTTPRGREAGAHIVGLDGVGADPPSSTAAASTEVKELRKGMAEMNKKMDAILGILQRSGVTIDQVRV